MGLKPIFFYKDILIPQLKRGLALGGISY